MSKNKIKNHFIFSYCGNKRNEVKNIYEIGKHLITDNIKYCVEPFCGSSSFSWYIYTHQNKKDLIYVLNDSNKNIIQLYNICINKEKLIEFEKKVNDIMKEELDGDLYTKSNYMNIIENKNNKYDGDCIYYIKNKIYCLRPGLFKNNYKYKYIDITNCPIIEFLQNAKIQISCEDGVEIYKQYENNENALIFIDPPYILSGNEFYLQKRTTIYEYMFYNKIENKKGNIILCLENSWIIKLLFEKNNKGDEYEKIYQNNKRKTQHIIIYNK